MIPQKFLNDPIAQQFIACFNAMLELAECLFRNQQRVLGRQLLRIAIISVYAYERAQVERTRVAQQIELRNWMLQLLEERYGGTFSVRSYYRYLERQIRMDLIE